MPYMIMMLDKPHSKAIRDEHRAAHYAYLIEHQSKLLLSGGLLQDDESQFMGGLIMLDVATRQEAEAFVANDPFTRAGLQESTRIERFRTAFANRQRVT